VAEERGVLLSGAGVLDRLELVTARPFRFPGLLHRLGPVAFQTFVSRLPEARHPGEPVFAGVRLSGKVHPRLMLAGQRAALIGGDSTTRPIDAERLAKAFVGLYGGIEDQIASVEVRWHLPTERWLPLSAYCEWGMEDTSGSFYKVPGILCGALVAALPGAPGVAAGVEHAHFAARCCGNPPWYRHHQFPGGWALSELPAALLDARLQLDGRAFRRERAGENLFVPGREGASLGVGGTARLRLGPSLEARLWGLREAGDGWSESRLALDTRIFF
jgi:hypothetical protein